MALTNTEPGFIKSLLSKAGSFFRFKQSKKVSWVRVTMDRLYYESGVSRFFLILKNSRPESTESMFVSLENVSEDLVMANLFNKNDAVRKIFQATGIKLKQVRVLKRTNTVRSAEILLGGFPFGRRVKVSVLEAVRMAYEHDVPIVVPENLLRAGMLDMSREAGKDGAAAGGLFATKYIGRELYDNPNEVVM